MWKRIFKRAGREAVAIAIAGATAYYSGNPYYVMLKPVITILGKAIRERGFFRNVLPF